MPITDKHVTLAENLALLDRIQDFDHLSVCIKLVFETIKVSLRAADQERILLAALRRNHILIEEHDILLVVMTVETVQVDLSS